MFWIIIAVNEYYFHYIEISDTMNGECYTTLTLLCRKIVDKVADVICNVKIYGAVWDLKYLMI